MKAYIVKNNQLSDYPGDLMIDGEIIKSFNLEFEVEMKGISIIIGKSMPSSLIKKLRDKGVVFVKANSIEEVKDLDIPQFNKDGTIKRGAGCQPKFKVK